MLIMAIVCSFLLGTPGLKGIFERSSYNDILDNHNKYYLVQKNDISFQFS